MRTFHPRSASRSCVVIAALVFSSILSLPTLARAAAEPDADAGLTSPVDPAVGPRASGPFGEPETSDPATGPLASDWAGDGLQPDSNGTNHRGYVFDPGNNTIHVVDTVLHEETGVSIDTTPYGDWPWRGALSPDGLWLYASLRDSDRVLVVDTATDTPVAAIPVGNQPSGIAFSADSAYAFVANRADDTVSVIETGVPTVTATIAVGDQPTSVANAFGANKLYVTNYWAGSVSVIDVDALAVAHEIGGLSSPWDIVVSPYGHRAYVSDRENGSIGVIDTASDSLVDTWRSGGNQIAGLDISPDGRRLYVADDYSGGPTTYVIDAISGRGIAAIPSEGAWDVEVFPAEAGALAYVSMPGSGHVDVVDIETNRTIDTIELGGEPEGLALFPQRTARLYGVQLGASTTEKGYTAGSVMVYTGVLYNLTGATDDLALTLADETWPTTLSITNTGSVFSGDSVEFNIQVEIPPTATTGMSDTVTISAVSMLSPTIYSDTVSIRTFASSGQYGYVSNPTNGEIDVLDTVLHVDTGLAIDTRPYGFWLRHIALSPNGHWLYASLDEVEEPGRVLVVDLDRLDGPHTSVAVGGGPGAIAFSAAGGYAFVANEWDGTVSVIDTDRLNVVATVPVGTEVSGLAVNPSLGKVYVVDRYDDSINVIDTQTLTAIQWIDDEGLDGPGDIVVSPDGSRAYVVSEWGGSIGVIDTAGDGIIDTWFIVEEGYLRGLDISPDGHTLYVAHEEEEEGSCTTYAVDTSTGEVIAVIPTGDARDVEVFPAWADPFAYVSLPWRGEIAVVDTGANSVVGSIWLSGAPGALALFPAGIGRLAVTLSPPAATRYGAPGSAVVHSVTLRNWTEETDRFTLSLSGNTWPAEISVGDTGPIPNGRSASLAVEVAIPSGAAVGTGDRVTVTARSVLSPTVYSATATVTTFAKGSYGYVLDSENGVIRVVDTSLHQDTGLAIDTRPYGSALRGGTLSPDGRRLYASLAEEDERGSVLVIDLDRLDGPYTSVAVGGGPGGIAFSAAGQYAFVANEWDSTVSVLDTNRLNVVATVPVGEGPTSIATGPCLDKIYVANNWDDSISVIDTRTLTVIRWIEGLGGLGDIVVSPDGYRAYVVRWGDSISVIETASDTVMDTWYIAGWRLRGLDISPDGRTLYVAHEGGGGETTYAVDTSTGEVLAAIPTRDAWDVEVFPAEAGPLAYVSTRWDGGVDVVDTSTNKVIGTIPLDGNAPTLALFPPSTVCHRGQRGYVFNPNNNEINLVDVALHRDTGVTIDISPYGDWPWRGALSPDGRWLYASLRDSDRVLVIDAATDTPLAALPVGDQPHGIAFSVDSAYAFVVNRADDTVSVIDTGAPTVTATIPVGDQPYSVANVFGANKLYVTNYWSGSVSVIDVSALSVTREIEGLSSPWDVVVSLDGRRAYVSNTGNGTIGVIDTAGDSLIATWPVGGDVLAGLDISPDGRTLYVADNSWDGGGSTVYVVDTGDGRVTGIIPTAGSWEVEVFPAEAGPLAYVSTPRSGRVEVVDTGTRRVMDTIWLGGGPRGLALFPPRPDFALTAADEMLATCGDGSDATTLEATALRGYAGSVTLSAAGLPLGATAVLGDDVLVTPGSTVLTITVSGAPTGAHPFTVSGSDGEATHTVDLTLHVAGGIPGVPELLTPLDRAGDQPASPTFTWAAEQAAVYDLEVATDEGFSNVVYTATVNGTGHTLDGRLDPDTRYYWRVRAGNGCGVGDFSTAFSFTTQEPVLLVDDDGGDPGVRFYYTAALDELGAFYDVWDTDDEEGYPDVEALALYGTVIWFTGEYGAGPDEPAEEALAAFLDGGGGLFISGAGYYSDGGSYNGQPDFMRDYLGVGYVGDQWRGCSGVYGEGSVFGGLGPYEFHEEIDCDVVSPDETADLAFTARYWYEPALSSGNGPAGRPAGLASPAADAHRDWEYYDAAVMKDSGIYRTTYWGFPFEAIPSAGDRVEGMAAVLHWLTPFEPDFSAAPRWGIAPLTVAFRDESAGAEEWQWDFGDGGTSTLRDPVHTYAWAGAYDVTLVALVEGELYTITRPAYVLASPVTPTQVSSGADGALCPAVAHDSDDEQSLVVWEQWQDGQADLLGRLVDGAGQPMGDAFTVSAATGDEESPAVAYSPAAGRYLVTWVDGRSGFAGRDLYGQLVDGDGLLVGEPFPIQVGVGGEEWAGAPAVEYNTVSGEFLVVWERRPDGDVLGQRLSTDGELLGDVIVVAVQAGGDPRPDVAHDETGAYLVVWAQLEYEDQLIILARPVLSDGALPDEGFNVRWCYGCDRPAVTYSEAAGSYLVVWKETGEWWLEEYQDDYDWPLGSFVDMLWAAWVPRVDMPWPDEELILLTVAAEGDLGPADVAYDPATGQAVVVWEDRRSGDWDVYAVAVDPDGSLAGEALPMAAHPADQRTPALGDAGSEGRLFVAWEDERDGVDVYGAAFRPLRAEFTADVTAGPAPLEVSFSDLSAPAGVEGWLWELGDGVTSTLQYPGHTYGNVRAYDVSLTVYSGTQRARHTKDDYVAATTMGDFMVYDPFDDVELDDKWYWYVPASGPTYSLAAEPSFFRLTVPGYRAYDHWSTVDSAPQLINEAVPVEVLAGDWVVETRLTLDQYDTGWPFHTGLIVRFAEYDLFYWGPYQGTNLRLERSGWSNLGEVVNGSPDVFLRIRKEGMTYSFEYRTDPQSAWQTAATQTTSAMPIELGFIAKTWGNVALVVDFDHFTFCGYRRPDALVSADTTWSSDDTLVVNSLVVTNSATLTLEGWDHSMAVEAMEVTVAGGAAISVDRMGYPSDAGPGAGALGGWRQGAGGGGHGGRGGDGEGGKAGGAPYGSVYRPDQAGSGGGRGYYSDYPGGRGGEAIRMIVTGTLSLEGAISAHGGAGTAASVFNAGGGAGGSIWVEAGRLVGSGTVRANGGAGGSSGPGAAGGGAGGRIALYAASYDFDGAVEVKGGSGYRAGGSGTVYLGRVDPLSSTVMALPPVGNVVDEVEGATISVTLVTTAGVPVAGEPVSLTVLSGSDCFVNGDPLAEGGSAFAGFSDADGVVTATLASTRVGTKTIEAWAGQVRLLETAEVSFVPGPVDAEASTISAYPAGLQIDGSGKATVNVYLRDRYDNGVPDQAVQLLAEGTAVTVTQPALPTGESGWTWGAILTTRAQTVSVRAVAVGEGITLTHQVEVVFKPGPVSAPGSVLDADPTTVAADGVEAVHVTVTLVDGFGNPVPGKAVALLTDGTAIGVTQPSALTGASGQVTATLRSTVAQTATLAAVDVTDGVTLMQEVVLTFLPGPPDPGTSSIAAVPAALQVDGASPTTVTVTLRDAHYNRLPGHAVELLAEGTAVTITQPSLPTDAAGQTRGTVLTTRAQTVTVGALAVTQGITLTSRVAIRFNPGSVSPSASDLSVTPGTIIADGADVATATVTLEDSFGNRVPGHSVRVYASGTAITVTQPAASTDAWGRARATIRGRDVQTITVTAVDTTAGVTLTQTASLALVAGPADRDRSTVAVWPGELVADDAETVAITVTLRDAAYHPLEGHAVALSVSGYGNRIEGPFPALTGADGVATFRLASTLAQGKTLTVVDTTDGITLTAHPQVTFVAGPPDGGQGVVWAYPVEVAADGVATATVEVWVYDRYHNPVPGATVVLSDTGSQTTLTQPAETGTDGRTRGAIASSAVEVVTVTASAAGVPIVDPARVTFAGADLAVAKSGPHTALAGFPVTYTLTVFDEGKLAAQGVVVTDTLPEGLAFVSHTAPFSFTQIDRTLTWQIGDLAVAAGVSFDLTAMPSPETPQWTQVTNRVEAATLSVEKDTADNTAEATATVFQPQPELRVTPAHTDLALQRGTAATVLLRAENAGMAAIGGVVALPPEHLGWVSVEPASLPDLAPGQSATFTATLAPPEDLPVGVYRDLVRVQAPGLDGSGAGLAVRIVGITRSLAVSVSDDFGPVASARVHLVRQEESVRVTDGVTTTVHEEAQGWTDGSGAVLLEGLEGGTYDYTAVASYHGAAQGAVTVVGGVGAQQLAVDLTGLPLLVPEPLYPEIYVRPGETGSCEAAVRNTGLGGATNVQITPPPALGWLHVGVTGPAQELGAGGMLSVTLFASPPETLPTPAIYQQFVDVRADNAPPTRFALTVYVDDQETGTAQLLVTGDDGQPVSGAQVTLVSQQSTLVVSGGNEYTYYESYTAKTDAGGVVSFEGIPTGGYTYHVDKDGYESFSGEAAVAPGGTCALNTSLEPKPFTVEWTVEETEITDVYEATVEITFQVDRLQVLPLDVCAPSEGGSEVGTIQVRNPAPFPVTNVHVEVAVEGASFDISGQGITIGAGQTAEFPFVAQVAGGTEARGRVTASADEVLDGWAPVKVSTSCTGGGEGGGGG